MDVAIRLRAVKRRYGEAEGSAFALADVSLEVPTGHLVAIVGTSGSGKTTLLNVIGGLDRQYQGTVEVCGKDLSGLSDREISAFRNRTIGFVFQAFHLLDHLSVEENVALPRLFARDGAPDKAHALDTLGRVGLADRAHELPRTLSGGQRQRIAIARALFVSPRVLLCDEPTGNLDTRTGGQILDLFHGLARDDKITVVVVTHEERVREAADRVYSLEEGRLTG